MGKQPFDTDDFPVHPDGNKVVKKDGEPIAVTPDPQHAEEIAERLNESELQRQDDQWSL